MVWQLVYLDWLSDCDCYGSNMLLLSRRFSMEALSGPWADLALLLRQTVMLSDQQQDTFVCLVGVLLFLSVSLLLLQLIIYLSWKLRQGEPQPVITSDCSSPSFIQLEIIWLKGKHISGGTQLIFYTILSVLHNPNLCIIAFDCRVSVQRPPTTTIKIISAS